MLVLGGPNVTDLYTEQVQKAAYHILRMRSSPTSHLPMRPLHFVSSDQGLGISK